MNREGILSGYRALDLTDTLGNVAGKILASMGVEILKVEPPGGDIMRNRIPDPEVEDKGGDNPSWRVNNTGKLGITLNLETERGRNLFRQLVTKVDFVLESFQPGYLDSLGIGYKDLSRLHPGLIMTSITVFGQKGPYSRYKGGELVASAMGGTLIGNGYPDSPPVKEALDANIFHANTAAVTASIMALHARQSGKEGQHVDVAIQEVSTTRGMVGKIVYQFDKQLMKRSGDRCQFGLFSARWIWECKDGYLWFNLMGGKVGAPANRALSQWMDEEGVDNPLKEMKDWNKFDRSTLDPDIRVRWEAAMDIFFKRFTKKQIAEEGMKRGMRACVANTPAELLNHPQLSARGFWGSFSDDTKDPKHLYPMAFFHSSQTENVPRCGAPDIGAHNSRIFQDELGLSMEEMEQLVREGVI